MADNTIIKRHELMEIMKRPEVKLVDGSWYLPAQARDARAEYIEGRIGEAVFFDIDTISDQSSHLPHMLPSAEQFADAVGAMGISETDDIVVYDGIGIFSAARVWWTFKLMGAKRVRVLEGGMDGWRRAGLPVNTGPIPQPEPVTFKVAPNHAMVRDLGDMLANTRSGKAIVLDARSAERFSGALPEPREGLASGHIPGARSLPFASLFDGEEMKSVKELQEIFARMGVDQDQAVITSCGSGVTAAIITLALHHAGLHNNALYDGSWTEWGQAEGVPIETGNA